MAVLVEQVPLYRLSQPFYDAPSSTYVAANEELEWEGVPNEHMEPLNEAARIEKQKWLDHIDSYPKPFNVGHRTAELSEMMVMSMANRPREGASGPSLEAILAAAEKLGVPATELAKALNAPAPSQAGPAETQARRRIATIAPSTPEEAQLTSRKIVRQETHLRVQEPVIKTRVRPNKVFSHAEADGPIGGSI